MKVINDDGRLRDINATRVWKRVGDLVAMDTKNPPVVEVLPPDSSSNGGSRNTTRFYQSLGASGAEYTNTSLWTAYYDVDDHLVVLQPTSDASSSEIEAVLAHEFVHAYQTNSPYEIRNLSHPVPRKAVEEGTAEFIEWQYADRYLPNYDSERAMTTRFRDAWAVQRIAWMPYVEGARYVRNHTESGAVLETMYRNPPTTSEQVLHGIDSGTEPPRQLAVHGGTSAGWSWDETSTGRWGEAPLRYALEIGLSREKARRAAAGWGNDRRMRFVSSEGYAYAWVIRWDTPSDAREFERAFTDYRANVSEPLALHSVGNETTVLISGPDSFVQNATVSGTQRNVTVAA